MYLERAKRFVKEKHSVRFKMVPKDVSSRYLESQPIILTINPVLFHSSTGFIF